MLRKWEDSPTSSGRPRRPQRPWGPFVIFAPCWRRKNWAVHWHCMPASFKGKPPTWGNGQFVYGSFIRSASSSCTFVFTLLTKVLKGYWMTVQALCGYLKAGLLVYGNGSDRVLLWCWTRCWTPYPRLDHIETRSSNHIKRVSEPQRKSKKNVLKTTEPAKFECPAIDQSPLVLFSFLADHVTVETAPTTISWQKVPTSWKRLHA